MTAMSKDDCFEDIKHLVLTTELAPGATLDEHALAAHYGLSRATLREVMTCLSSAGYLQIEPHNNVVKVASMDIGTMRTFFQTAPMVYANVARLAAENRTSMQIDQLKGVQAALVKATDDGDTKATALENHRFHACIVEMTQNPYLAAAMERLLIDHTRLGQTFFNPTTQDDRDLINTASAQHDSMIAAIEARQTALVIDLALQHWDLSRDELERFVRPDPLPVDVISFKDRRDAF